MSPLSRRLLAAGLAVLGACVPTAPEPLVPSPDAAARTKGALPQLPGARVRDVSPSGAPAWIDGDLGLLGTGADRFAPAVERLAPAFRLRTDELAPRSVHTDAQGFTHARYRQVASGLPVVNGELVLHADPRGRVYLANGLLRGGVAPSTAPAVTEGAAAQRAVDATPGRVSATGTRLVFHLSPETGALALAHEVTVEGLDPQGEPLLDRVYVDAQTGGLLARHPRIHSALERVVFSANNGRSLPGTRLRTEGGAATGDAVVDDNYAHLGTTYDCYRAVFGRDSYDGLGTPLRSSVHFSTNYVNAFWNGSQMVYGDGSASGAAPLGRDLDVTVHELTHAVTGSGSDLVYANESGALNEAMSDVFAAGCESWTRAWSDDDDVWKIAEDVWTPGTAGDALRYMGNPTQDGASRDYYPERYTGTDDGGGVHWNSGIANLAFKLLATGGMHPRGKTGVSVSGVGVERALRIFYKANTDLLTSTATFQAARNATAQAAADLGYDLATVASVQAAWDAVGVPSGATPAPAVVPLGQGATVAGLEGERGSVRHYQLSVPPGTSELRIVTQGGSGDLDLYVRYGAPASPRTFQCASEGPGTNEACVLTNPPAGDWYVLVYAYDAYAGVSLEASTSAMRDTNVLQNGVAVYGLWGAAGSEQTWSLDVPQGAASLTLSVSGGTGDVDLYVQHGEVPTTSSYRCRPFRAGNWETCAFSAPASGTWHVMLRGYAAYGDVTLLGQY